MLFIELFLHPFSVEKHLSVSGPVFSLITVELFFFNPTCIQVKHCRLVFSPTHFQFYNCSRFDSHFLILIIPALIN